MEQNLREQVVQQVRAEIISGQSVPGTMYSVPTLATSLGISTTPVREALLELTRSGLIEPMRNRGFKVVEPTLTELRNLFDLREVLELHAAAIVARKPKRDLEGLYRFADDIARAVKTEDLRLYLESDRSFHQLLTAAADNARLTELVMGLRDQMRLYGIKSRAGLARQNESTAEHYQIIELAMAGKEEALTNLLRHHIRAWEPIFVEALSQVTIPREPIAVNRGRGR
ncbi:GntR family transcriptional regulator [Bradyrhizobium neotropicale]|uniref:GntR family transcriptional regulator n=1 Tax=Bradyrhizobium neotropicale TaxID=1497615 RepID=UPI001AD68AD2|nr:GntR family transcriptional regulator [Bradyrhizobium neotropicale]MBO4222182.1 FCD domain-containing protein [Bradyrhizobium neotropicale]